MGFQTGKYEILQRSEQMKKHTREQKRRLMELKELLGQSNYENVVQRFAGRTIHFPERPESTEDRMASLSSVSEGQNYRDE